MLEHYRKIDELLELHCMKKFVYRTLGFGSLFFECIDHCLANGLLHEWRFLLQTIKCLFNNVLLQLLIFRLALLLFAPHAKERVNKELKCIQYAVNFLHTPLNALGFELPREE